ncbi:hypothetical protein HYG81_07045 [Natrinema zhouii]|uniref:Uncharacterized protein n=1 Tax=Natrinema zhouii TaxID=1710539 RepID=A0A7D6CTC7_9EURY|nr:hypothetical protein [Natrinema zhouii]QLK27351.1 hypothetical protein HYG81_07045 [Natrinema zhouii]
MNARNRARGPPEGSVANAASRGNRRSRRRESGGEFWFDAFFETALLRVADGIGATEDAFAPRTADPVIDSGSGSGTRVSGDDGVAIS